MIVVWRPTWRISIVDGTNEQHSGLKQRLSTVNHIVIVLCTMIDANPLPYGIVCASAFAALFLFRAMLMTHAGGYGKVRTLWICTLFAITMQMTIPIAMFHRFSLASFMQAVRINHDYVWCFDYVGCWVFGGCGMWLWRNIDVCSLQYKVTQSRQQVLWEAAKMEMRRIFCERLQKLRGCKIGGNLQLFLALIYWLLYVE